TLAVDRAASGRSAGVANPADYSETVSISGGQFSATVRDPAGNTNPVTDTYTWTVGALPTTSSFDIRWLRSVVPTSISGVSLNAVTSFPIAETSPLSVASYV